MENRRRQRRHFWNLFGAGVLGFFINLPFVSYFEHGSFLTAAHGHGALMGVYGMLAIALALFSLRNIVEPRYWKEKWLMAGFWGLNIGLMGMIAVTVFPVGVMQAMESFCNGFWSARSLEFYQQPIVNLLLWLRIVPDTIFIAVGIVPVLGAVAWGYLHLRKVSEFAVVEKEERRELIGA
jgi:nitric oxide reductase subunit B